MENGRPQKFQRWTNPPFAHSSCLYLLLASGTSPLPAPRGTLYHRQQSCQENGGLSFGLASQAPNSRAREDWSSSTDPVTCCPDSYRTISRRASIVLESGVKQYRRMPVKCGAGPGAWAAAIPGEATDWHRDGRQRRRLTATDPGASMSAAMRSAGRSAPGVSGAMDRVLRAGDLPQKRELGSPQEVWHNPNLEQAKRAPGQ